MITPVTASETYLPTRSSRSQRGHTGGRLRLNIGGEALGSHPFLNSTDQPVKNFGSLVKSRTAKSMKKKEMEPSAKLKHSRSRQSKELQASSWPRLVPARDNVREASLDGPQLPVLLHDHSLGFGLRLGSLVLPEAQPAFLEEKARGSGWDHGARGAGADAELPRAQSTVEEGDPQPAHHQEDEHEGERERKPGAEVDQLAVWEVAGRQRRSPQAPRFGRCDCAGGVFF